MASPSDAAPARWSPWTASGPRGRLLLIAEIANAHEGRSDDAARMVSAAAEAGAGAVKFQKYYSEEMLAPGHPMMEKFKGWEWPEAEWRRLIELARSLDLMTFVDVFGERAYRSLSDLPPVDGLKIHGADIANTPLLRRLSEDPRPVLIGTGGSSDLDVHRALAALDRPERVVLMHGYQAFPTPLSETALSRIPRMAQAFGVAAGISDHLDAEHPLAGIVPLMAVPLGVCCVEKHMTLDRSKRGVDHQSALEPRELAQLASRLKDAEAALGDTELPKSALEEGYRRRFKKAVLASRPLKAGETLGPGDVMHRMVSDPPRHTLRDEDVVGRTAARDVAAGAVLSGKDLGFTAGLCLVVRLKSQRLPRKALADVHGRSAVERLIARAKLCRAAERAVLCTSSLPDDAPLLEIARERNVAAYAGSPEEPLQRLIACCETYGWRYAIRVTGDNIFLDPGLLAQAVEAALEQNLDYVSMRGAPVGARCEVISLPALRAIERHARASFTSEYLTWFLAENPNFRSLDLPLAPELARDWSLTLDTPEDLRNIREAVSRLGPGRDDYTLAELVRAVESDPELAARCRLPASAAPAPKAEFDFRVAR